MKWMKRMVLLIIGSSLYLSACQGNTGSTTGMTQPPGTQPTQTETKPWTQPAATGTTQPVTTPATTPAVTTPAATTAGPGDVRLGNLNRNYSTRGLYAETDQWVWFSRQPDYQLSRMRKDGSELKSFDAEHVMNINLVGNEVYYEVLEDVGEDMGGSLYRMDQEGTEGTKVTPVRVLPYGGCLIIDDWIYFSNADDEYRIYRMDLEGNDLTKMSDHPTLTMNYEDGWIFYLMNLWNKATGDQSLELRKMKLDGSEDVPLVKPGDQQFLADRGWLYYLDAQGNLYRMKYDATENTKVVAEQVVEYTIDGDRLYYTGVANRHLMSSRLDGSEIRELVDFPCMGVQIAGGWIYVRDDNQRMFRLKGDGSGLEKAYTPEIVEPDPPGTPVVEGLGVINANLMWGSNFVIQGDWIYGIDDSGPESSVIRMKRDGSQRSALAEKQVGALNLVGDWLYFVDRDANGSIARMKTDGSGYGVIHDASVTGIIVRDNWIYFIEGVNNQIQKIKTDGTELTKLSEGNATGLRLDGEWLYWSTSINAHSESQDIYRTRIDGSAEELLMKENISGMDVAEGYVYFGHSEEMSRSMGISRMNLDGSNSENILPEFAISLIGVYKGKLYYYDRIDESELYRAELDGSKPERLIDFGDFREIHFLDDQILFFDRGSSKFRLTDLDGSHVRDYGK